MKDKEKIDHNPNFGIIKLNDINLCLRNIMDLLELFKDAETIIEIDAEHVIFEKGDDGDEMYVVLEGIISLSAGYEVLDIIEAGDVFGEMAIIDDKMRSATAVAQTDCRIVPVSRKAFISMVSETPDFSLHVMSVLAERLRTMIEGVLK